jgi:hypothetical protein
MIYRAIQSPIMLYLENMYTNIPKHDTVNLISNVLKNNPEINENTQKETLHKLQTGWNKITFNLTKNTTNGLAMGASTSAILAETYIQHVEHKQIYPILIKQQITGYFRYIDDILIIYN